MTSTLSRAISRIRRSSADAPPGLALAVETPAGVIAEVDGVRELAGARPETTRDLPMTVGTHHDLASVTKAVATTAAIMRLVDVDELALDASVRSFLPSSSLAVRVTVRDLLYHRSGLWEWWPLYCEARDTAAAHRVLDLLAPRYEPDTARHYSDLGFMLLGRIVESVSSMELADAVRVLVLDPLGLGQTGYAHPLGDDVAASSSGDDLEFGMIDTGVPYPVPFRTEQFTGWRHGLVVGEVNDGNAFHALGGISGHAGLFSTVGDLLAFGRRLAAPFDDDSFVSGVVRRQFFAEGPDGGQALGFRRYSMELGGGSVDVLGHPGFTGVTLGWIPEREISIVLATNRLHVAGSPLPNEGMWATALDGAGTVLDALR